MNQLVALKIQPPEFSYPKVANAVQQYQMGEEKLRGAQMDNQLAGMKLQAAGDQFTAERDFRQRAASGDPNADQALSGFPEMQKKLWDAFDGMSPSQYKAAKKRSTRMGEAARNVLLYKDGSPEQAEAWNTEITGLVKDGIIGRDQGDALITSGPNPLLIEQALSVEQWSKLYQRRQEFATKEQRLAEKDAAADQRANDRLAIQKDRLEMAKDKAKLDSERIRSVIEKNRGGGKGGNEDAVARDEIKKSLDAFRKSLRIDDADFRTDEPEAYDSAVERYETYRTEVFKDFGFGPDGRRLKPRAMGVDKVAEQSADGDGDTTPYNRGGPEKTATNKATNERVRFNYDTGKWDPM